MLPFPTETPPPDAAPAPSAAVPAGPAALGAAPDQATSAPPTEKGFPWLMVGAAGLAVGAAAGLGWFLLRKKPGSAARLGNPSVGAVAGAVEPAPDKPVKSKEPVFTLDDAPETFTLTEFLDNNEHLSNDDLEKIEVMKVGDQHALGGGAWARFVLKRVG